MTEKTCLTDGSPVTEDHRDIDPTTGMQKSYVVLCPEERAKGFVRPLRQTYRHVGIKPKYPTRELTPEEHEQYDRYKYVVYEKYPEDEALVGRYWTQEQLNSGCGNTTTMSLPLAETYARKPNFYGGTFCAACGNHFPVGEHGEFVWDGTDERVGT